MFHVFCRGAPVPTLFFYVKNIIWRIQDVRNCISGRCGKQLRDAYYTLFRYKFAYDIVLMFLGKTFSQRWIQLLNATTDFRFCYVLQWRLNERDGVSNHQPLDCLLNCLFRRRSKKSSKLRVTGLCAGIHRWPVSPFVVAKPSQCFRYVVKFSKYDTSYEKSRCCPGIFFCSLH